MHSRIFISGTDGFVGRNLLEYFQQNQNGRVYAASFEQMDLRQERTVAEYLKRHKIDTVIHCATSPLNGKEYGSKVLEDNLRMFFNLVRALPEHGTLINLCSGSVYGREHWIDEMPEEYFDRHVPSDAHSYSKYVIAKYSSEAKIKVITIRLFGVYGRYEDYRYKFISNSIAKALSGINIKIARNNIFHYLYINDLSRAVSQILHVVELAPRVMNLVPTEKVSLLELAEIVKQAVKSDVNISVINNDPIYYTGTNQVFKRLLPNFQFTPIKDAVLELADYYIKTHNQLDIQSLLVDDYFVQANKINAVTKS